MKILAICGSPRKGNTFSVLSSIKESYPGIDFKILQLAKMNFEYYKDKTNYYYDRKIPFYKKFIAKKVVNKIVAGFD